MSAQTETLESKEISSEQSSPVVGPSGRSHHWLDIGALGLIVGTVLVAFSKTFFSSEPISRLYQLAQRDSLFSRYLSGTREGYDASVYQYFVPNHFFTVQSLLNGNLPLWNPLTGCGAPHLADVETAVCWPLRICLLFVEPIRAWNLLLVLNIGFYGAGSYLLSRSLGLSRVPSVLAALALAFCPYLIFQSELIGGCASLTPLVMTGFVKMAGSRRWLWKALTSAACAVMVLSGHPEPVFFGIAAACVLRLCLAVFAKNEGAGQHSVLSELMRAVSDIAVVGMLSFGLCAFVLLPFLELLGNTECYKLGLNGADFGVPLNTVLVNLFHPAYGACSPFLGIAVPVLIFVAVVSARKNKNVPALGTSLVVCLALMCRVGPLEHLLTLKGLSWFVPKYSWPAVLILMSVLAGFGAESFMVRRGGVRPGKSPDKTGSPAVRENGGVFNLRAAAVTFLCSCALTALVLAALKLVPALLAAKPMDEAFSQLAVTQKAWIKDLVLLGVLGAGAALFAVPGRVGAALSAVLLVVCGAVSLGPVTKAASPPKPKVKYDAVEPIPFLKASGARIISMGRHVFCPDSNLVYGIQNIVPVNVYHPLRFQEFMKEAGVTHEGVNQFFDGRLGKFIDLASVKYAVSPLPVLGRGELQGASQPLVRPANWLLQHDKVSLTAGCLNLYAANSEVLGKLVFSAPNKRASDIAWQPVLLDAQGRVVWFGDLERMQYMFAVNKAAGNGVFEKDVAVAVPTRLNQTEELTLAAQLFDWSNNCYILPEEERFNEPDKKALVLLAKFRPNGAKPAEKLLLEVQHEDSGARRFKLVSETESRVRVYENLSALPAAYFVSEAGVTTAKTPTEVFQKLTSDSFDPHAGAVLELPSPLERAATPASPIVPCSLLRSSTDSVTVECKSSGSGFVILTDTFYPGWTAKIVQNGVKTEAPIYRANYLFRAVPVPAGNCVVEFSYCPKSFLLGLLLGAFAVCVIAVMFFVESRRGER